MARRKQRTREDRLRDLEARIDDLQHWSAPSVVSPPTLI